MADDRNTTAEYYSLSTDETTILRHEQIRLREVVYSGTTDSDAQTDINMVGIPINAEVVAISAMINDNVATTTWRIVDNLDAASAGNAFRLEWIRNTSGYRIVRLAAVGVNLQSRPYRVWVKWVEKL